MQNLKVFRVKGENNFSVDSYGQRDGPSRTTLFTSGVHNPYVPPVS